MAWRYVTERDDTLVAQAFATSSGRDSQYGWCDWSDGASRHTGTVVESLQQGEHGAEGEHIGVFFKNHVGQLDFAGCTSARVKGDVLTCIHLSLGYIICSQYGFLGGNRSYCLTASSTSDSRARTHVGVSALPASLGAAGLPGAVQAYLGAMKLGKSGVGLLGGAELRLG